MKKYAFGLVLILVSSIAYAQMKAEPEGDGPSCSVILEPIYSSGPPVANPCGIAVNDTATFIAKVSPSSISDNAIKWESSSGCISFVGGNWGRSVQVKGNHAGTATLRVSVEGFDPPSSPTNFAVRVLEKKTVKVYVGIVCDTDGSNPTVTESKVKSYLDTANAIFKQVAMEFEVEGDIRYLRKGLSWKLPGVEEYTKMLNEIEKDGVGLELYFIGNNLAIVNETGSVGKHSPAGTIITTRASQTTVAHEIGHACGLKDIYVGKCPFPVNPEASVSNEWVPNDWAGGYGNLKHVALTTNRLIMYGVSSPSRGYDIPAGPVWGETKLSTGIYDKTNVDVGGIESDERRNPTHN